MRGVAWFVALLWVLAGSMAAAQVYEWTDGDGNRHFTNIKESVPASEQANARLVVGEWHAAPLAEPAMPAAPRREEPQGDRQVQVVYDHADLESAYADGIRDALAFAAAQSRPQAPSVQIQGPLAVANADVASSGYAYPGYVDYPLVTTSFDRGRSRHLTLRMLLQDQFQVDRDGPFFHERLPIGLGPGLNPFLPRGLPNRIPPGARVLFR